LKINLLFFGKLTDMAGDRESETDLPTGVSSVSALIDWLAGEDATLGEALREKSTRAMVNRSIVAGDVTITDGDEVAFMPPVSGG